MSNSHLFMNSGFPRAPLQNGIGRYMCQLQRITIKFCKHSGASRGVRKFLENGLIDFASKYPGVVVYVKPRRHRTPCLSVEYLNGEKQYVSCHNLTEEEVGKWINLLRTQGSGLTLRYRKMWHTDHPSVQGVWTPFTNKPYHSNLEKYPNDHISSINCVESTATQQILKMFEEQKSSKEDSQPIEDEKLK